MDVGWMLDGCWMMLDEEAAGCGATSPWTKTVRTRTTRTRTARTRTGRTRSARTRTVRPGQSARTRTGRTRTARAYRNWNEIFQHVVCMCAWMHAAKTRTGLQTNGKGGAIVIDDGNHFKWLRAAAGHGRNNRNSSTHSALCSRLRVLALKRMDRPRQLAHFNACSR